MRAGAARKKGDLEGRLEALAEALDVAEWRLDAADVEHGKAVLARVGERLRLGPELTVAALAGATGSGKSSLFNGLSGEDLSSVGVRRPTTGAVHASVWGNGAAEPLLTWLGAARRHRIEARAGLDGLVLLDLPDHDSTEMSHRLEVDRLVQLVDLLAWVVDPQKYADAALHDRYLRPLAAYASVMIVVLNHVDELDADARDACLADLHRLLEADGLASVPVLTTSARTGEGIDELRSVLEARVSARRSALERLAADADEVAGRLAHGCASDGSARSPGRADRALLIEVLSDAAGVDTVGRAVARAHRHRAALAAGWPPTRWLRRVRPDPLRRFHLDLPQSDAGSSSLPPATPVQRARIETALRNLADASAGHLPEPWPRNVRAAADESASTLPRALDRAVTETDLGMRRRPWWWKLAGALHTVLLVVAAVGALWLAALFGIVWLRLPDPPVPEVESIPLPTLMLLGGLLAGVVLGGIAGVAARVGARRRMASARRRLVAAVSAVADERVLAPVHAELEAHDRICAALARRRGAP